MRAKWIGLVAVLGIAGAIIGYRTHVSATAQVASTGAPLPRVLLVADMSEANTPGDACAEIIHLVRDAQARGIAVQELQPGSHSNVLMRYRVLTVPTVLILDHEGQVVSRFEGEGRDTVEAVRTGLGQLH